MVVFVGLGSLYGDHELHDENMDRQAELRIVEKYLSKNLEILMWVLTSNHIHMKASSVV